MQKNRAGNFDTKKKPAVQRRFELEVKDMAAICKCINKKKSVVISCGKANLFRVKSLYISITGN